MNDNGQDNGRAVGQSVKTGRQERLKQALRENLKRRKSQGRKPGGFTLASPHSGEATRDDEEGPDK